jgi:hypothetical protein
VLIPCAVVAVVIGKLELKARNDFLVAKEQIWLAAKYDVAITLMEEI